MFELDPILKKDTIELADWSLSKLLLMNDSQYPWFILVPKVAGVTEIIDLNEAQRETLMAESCRLATLLKEVFKPKKLNIAALGNVVSQLHVHHVARYETDKAWPAPIWGVHPVVPYTEQQLEQLMKLSQW